MAGATWGSLSAMMGSFWVRRGWASALMGADSMGSWDHFMYSWDVSVGCALADPC